MTDPSKEQSSFINWFRDSSPYIHAHRKKTFVIFFGGEAVQSEFFAHHLHDFALLNSLGIRLVLVHGIRPQIEQRLKKNNHPSIFVDPYRITDHTALQYVKESVGTVRVEIEALLSMGLANSPMSGAKIKVSSGNFITAKPIGVLNGTDFCSTGKIRRIDSAAINAQLHNNTVILISPIGYSPSGEVFNLSAEEVATEVAIALQADKLILMTENNCLNNTDQQLIPQLTISEANALLKKSQNNAIKPSLTAAIKACQGNVNRVHLINCHLEGALLLELFSRNGVGTLISANSYEKLRAANTHDIPGILELIRPLEAENKLIKRSREHLEIDIGNYSILERDGLIIGCIALNTFPDTTLAEVACLAVHPNYQHTARGQQLLTHALTQAKQKGIFQVIVFSTQTTHWFIEQGFQEIDLTSIPEIGIKPQQIERNAKILHKKTP